MLILIYFWLSRKSHLINILWIKPFCRCNKDTEITDLRYKATKLRPHSEWEFRVCAENAAGAGPFSEPSAMIKVQDPLFPPAAPGGFRITDTTRSSICLAWNTPLYDGGSAIVGYLLEMAECLPDQDEDWKKYVVDRAGQNLAPESYDSELSTRLQVFECHSSRHHNSMYVVESSNIHLLCNHKENTPSYK